MLRVIVLCLLFVFVYSETTIVSRCTLNEGELPVNQYVEGCTTPPCLLPQLQDVVVDVIFKVPRTLQTMRTLATASVNFGIPMDIPYDLGANAVTCNFLTNTYCPVLKDEVVRYTLRMFIEPFFFVGTHAVVEFRVVDDNNEAIWCIQVPITITPPLETTQN